MVTVRLVPLPPKTMLALGTNPWLDEVPLGVKLLAGVSGSLTVKAMGAVGVLTVVAWLPMSLMVGGCGWGAVEVVVRVRLHLLIDPWSPSPSSTTYRDQVPLAGWPLNTDKAAL